MTTSIRRTALQPTTGTPTTDLDQKKDQTRNRVKNIAAGVIIGLSLATAAYLGHGYIFGNTQIQPYHSSRMCELGFIVAMDQNTKHLPGSPVYSKARTDFLNSAHYKKCVGDYDAKKLSELFTKVCEAYKTHWLCV